jgi:hypothetical protein
MCASGVSIVCFTDPESRGGRSAEKRSGARRNTRGARRLASKTRVNALMTRHARRLARRPASHDAGRSPLGAPPWRFWAPGAALPSPWAPAVLQRRAVALRIRRASSSHPGRSAWRATSRASRGERLRAARRRTPLLAPPSGSSPETPLDERGWGCSSINAIRSQYLYPSRSHPPGRSPGLARACRSQGPRVERSNVGCDGKTRGGVTP